MPINIYRFPLNILTSCRFFFLTFSGLTWPVLEVIFSLGVKQEKQEIKDIQEMKKKTLSRRIFLVDDDKDLSKITATALSRRGYEVDIFHNAERFLESVHLTRPDMILMDIMLPLLSGAEAVKRLNKTGQGDIPVVFLTALISSEEDLEKTGIDIDGKNYKMLGKPYEIEHLYRTIEQSFPGKGDR